MNNHESFSLSLSNSKLLISTPGLDPLSLSAPSPSPQLPSKIISFYECCEFDLIKKEYQRIVTELKYKPTPQAKTKLKTLEFNFRKSLSHGQAIYSVDPTNQKISDQLIFRKQPIPETETQIYCNSQVLIDNHWVSLPHEEVSTVPLPSSWSTKPCSPFQWFKHKQRFYHFTLRKQWSKIFSWLYFYWTKSDLWAVSILWDQYKPPTVNDLLWSITPSYSEIGWEIDPRIDLEHFMCQKTLNPQLSPETYLEQWGPQFYENNFEILVPPHLLEQVHKIEDKEYFPQINLPPFNLTIDTSVPMTVLEPMAEDRVIALPKKVLFLNLYAHKTVLLNKNHDPVPFFVDLAQSHYKDWEIFVNSPHPPKSSLAKIQSNLPTVPISWDQILDEVGFDYFDQIVLTINSAIVNNLNNRQNFKKEIDPRFPLLIQSLSKTKTPIMIPDFGIYRSFNLKSLPYTEVIGFDPFIPPFEVGQRPLAMWSKNYDLISANRLNPTIDLVSKTRLPFNVTNLRFDRKNYAETRFYWLSEKDPLSKSVEMLGKFGAICLISQSHPKSFLFEQNNLNQLIIKSQNDLDTIVKLDCEAETELRRRLSSIFL